MASGQAKIRHQFGIAIPRPRHKHQPTNAMRQNKTQQRSRLNSCQKHASGQLGCRRWVLFSPLQPHHIYPEFHPMYTHAPAACSISFQARSNQGPDSTAATATKITQPGLLQQAESPAEARDSSQGYCLAPHTSVHRPNCTLTLATHPPWHTH